MEYLPGGSAVLIVVLLIWNISLSLKLKEIRVEFEQRDSFRKEDFERVNTRCWKLIGDFDDLVDSLGYAKNTESLPKWVKK